GVPPVSRLRAHQRVRTRSFVVGVDPAADTLQYVFSDQVVAGQLDRVFAVEASLAEPGLWLLGGADQPGQRDIAEGVGTDRAADALGVQPAGDELSPGGEVDAVEARPLDRRRGDPYVYLQGAGLAQHADDGPLGVAAHDRVVHHHHPLAAYVLPQRVELEPDAELPDSLGRLDESAADVAALDQPGA